MAWTDKDLDEHKKQMDPLGRRFRKVGKPVGNFLLKHTSLTGDQVTWLGLVCGLLAALFYGFGQYALSLVAFLFIILALVVDYADGVVARGRGTSSTYGDWLDSAVDGVKTYMIIIGITFGVWIQTGMVSAWFLGSVCLSGFALIHVMTFLSIRCFGETQLTVSGHASASTSGLLGLLVKYRLTTSPYFVVMGIMTLIGQLYLFLAFYALYTTGGWVAEFYILNKKFRGERK